MINTLKAMLESDTDAVDNVTTDDMLATHANRISIRDMFLDDKEALVLGAEDDPEVAKFVESIPVDDEDAKPVTAEDVAKITESMDSYFGDLKDTNDK